MLRLMLRRLKNFFGYRRDCILILSMLFRKRRNTLILCDLDNTLVFTGQYCVDNNCGLEDAYDNSKTNGRMLDFLNSKLNSETEVLILSARNYKLRKRTVERVNSINQNYGELFFREIILCPRMKDKLFIVNLLRWKFDRIIVVDDFSGGHETGVVKWNAELFNKMVKLKNVTVYSLYNCDFFI